MQRRFLKSCQALVVAQTICAVASCVPASAQAVGTPPGGNRAPLNFHAGTPFSISTWTPAQNAHIPGIANGKGLPMHGFGLDLSSNTASIVLGRNLFHRHTDIMLDLGGTPTAFTPGEKVTPAEYVAILQQITRSTLALTLGSAGQAVGGEFSLNGLISPRITGLTIPQGVVAIDNIARNPLLGLAGNLTNDGSLYVYTSSPRIRTGLIYAGYGGSIQNDTGGLISTMLPAGVLPSTYRALQTANLVLAADQNIVNYGTILGSGSLKFATAYGSIINGNSNTTGASIQAVGDVAFVPGTTGTFRAPTGSANVTNLGTVTSTGGDITINSPLALADLYITGTGVNSNNAIVTGLFQAYQGAIDVRDIRYHGPANTLFNGGAYQASGGLNLFAGFGSIVADGSIVNSLATSPIYAGILSTRSIGLVSLNDLTSSGITVNNSTAGSFALTTAGSTNLNSISTSNGDLSVVAATGTLQTLPAVQLSAHNGSVLLQNLDDSTGNIVIGTASRITTSGTGSGPNGSNVILAVGPGTTYTASNPIPSNNAPPNVIINTPGTGNVYAGSMGFTANPGMNVLTANTANIVFYTSGSATANSITLNGFVNITADPVSDKETVNADECIVDTGADADT